VIWAAEIKVEEGGKKERNEVYLNIKQKGKKH
jgi:hypothetical protein